MLQHIALGTIKITSFDLILNLFVENLFGTKISQKSGHFDMKYWGENLPVQFFHLKFYTLVTSFSNGIAHFK